MILIKKCLLLIFETVTFNMLWVEFMEFSRICVFKDKKDNELNNSFGFLKAKMNSEAEAQRMK